MSKQWKVIRENRHEEDETYTGPGGVICPKCGHGSIHMFDHVRRGRFIDSFMIHCWDCDETYGVSSINIIDPNITRAIAKLNQKGYKTDSSCEGHNDDSDSGGHAYIKFKDISLKDFIKEHPLPAPWFLGDKGIDQSMFIIRAAECKCSTEDWNARCDRITDWVDSLPAVSSDKTFKYGYWN